MSKSNKEFSHLLSIGRFLGIVKTFRFVMSLTTFLIYLATYTSAFGENTPQHKYSSPANKETLAPATCDAIPKVANFEGRPGLSHLWAQEYVGADLAKQHINTQYTNQAAPLVGVIEDDISHGSAVTSLVYNSNPNHASAAAKANLKEGNFSASTPELWHPFHESKDTKVPEGLRLLNVSRPLSPAIDLNSPTGEVEKGSLVNLTARVDSLLKQGVTIVKSAGNSYLEGRRKSFANERHLEQTHTGLIVVGNMASSGIAHFATDHSANVSVHAPSAASILSYGKSSPSEDEKAVFFGGTSGATPLVTGSLANLLVAVPELNPAQQKLLLERSSLKTLASITPPQHMGAGMLNSYKMLRLGEKIRESCLKNRAIDQSCLEIILSKSDIENFPELQSQTPLTAARKLWPDCQKSNAEGSAGTVGDSNLNCNKKEALDALRRYALLLTNSDSTPWKLLACIYKKEGYPENALFYESVALANEHQNSSPAKRNEIAKSYAEKVAQNSKLIDEMGSAIRILIDLDPEKVISLSESRPLFAAAVFRYLSRSRWPVPQVFKENLPRLSKALYVGYSQNRKLFEATPEDPIPVEFLSAFRYFFSDKGNEDAIKVHQEILSSLQSLGDTTKKDELYSKITESLAKRIETLQIRGTKKGNPKERPSNTQKVL